MKFRNLFLVAVIILIAASCQRDNWLEGKTEVPVLPNTPYQYNDELPPYMEDEKGETISNKLVALGRVLFYDENLSATSRTSCGSCHQQRLAFSDGLQFTPGFINELTPRNTMQLVNVRMQTEFLWDMRAGTIPEQVLLPIENHIEMGITDMDALMERIGEISYYPDLFTDAFGIPEVTEEKVSLAMAEFVKAMVSYRSKFDVAYNFQSEMPDSNKMSNEEIFGFNLFTHALICHKCHGLPNFAGSGSSDAANIGLDMVYEDPGMAGWTGLETNIGVFKSPSLRNIEVTAPYMHDGRFATLEEVIDHYSDGMHPHPELDFRLINFSADDPGIPGLEVPLGGMHISPLEKHALVAFMKTLTDDYFLSDVRYSNPFILQDN